MGLHQANRSLPEGWEQKSVAPEDSQETCQICPADEWQPFPRMLPSRMSIFFFAIVFTDYVK